MNSGLKTKSKIVIVMPAYNAERTVRDTYKEIPLKLRRHIILVDDGSKDKTVATAKKLGIKVFEHSNNLGYGGNQKTCYWEALKLNPDVVVMLHPDYQYDATLIEELIEPILKGRYDFMFGSRIANKRTALAGGMPPLKYYVNRLVCLIQNILLGTNFSEQFSGFRAFSANLLNKVPFQRFSNDFVFDQEMTVSALSYGFRIGEIAIPTRYHEKASSIQFLKGIKFILEGFWVIFKYYLNNLGLLGDRRFATSNTGKISFFPFFAIVLISGMNLFIYKVFEVSSLFALLVFLNSILLYLSIASKNGLVRIMFFGLLLILIVFTLKNGFDNGLVEKSRLEADALIKRQEHFALGLGKIYRNRFGIYYFKNVHTVLTKINENFFAHLDFRLVFNFDVVTRLFLIPPFLLGMYELVRRPSKVFVLYFIIVFAMGGFLQANRYFGLYLYIPFISLSILLGLKTILKMKI